jgi:Sensors of blue-light using FAD
MDLRSLTYTSLASLHISIADVDSIHRTARDLNAIDGVTGMLVFNGTHFLQIIEGGDTAIEDLLERLRRDPRHSGLEVRDDRVIHERSFPDWSMELVRVRSAYLEAKETLSRQIPESVAPDVRARIDKMTEAIFRTIEL